MWCGGFCGLCGVSGWAWKGGKEGRVWMPDHRHGGMLLWNVRPEVSVVQHLKVWRALLKHLLSTAELSPGVAQRTRQSIKGQKYLAIGSFHDMGVLSGIAMHAAFSSPIDLTLTNTRFPVLLPLAFSILPHSFWCGWD